MRCGLDTGALRRSWLWDVSNVGVVHGLADAEDHIEVGVRLGRLPLGVAALDGLEGIGVLGPAGAARGGRRGQAEFRPESGQSQAEHHLIIPDDALGTLALVEGETLCVSRCEEGGVAVGQ